MNIGLVATRAPHEVLARLQENLSTVIRGKSEAIDQLLVAMLADGHVLIEDVPGTGKTTLAKALAGLVHRQLFAHPVYAGSVADRYHGRHDLLCRQRQFHLPARPGLRQHCAGGRDQPRLPAHAIGFARSHGRATGDHGRRDPSVAASVPRARHAEPRRI